MVKLVMTFSILARVCGSVISLAETRITIVIIVHIS